MFTKKTTIIILLIFFILTGLAIGGILVQKNALEAQPSPPPNPLVIVSPQPTPTPSPTPNPSPEPEVILSDYQVQVLNGTGGRGVAGAVKDILEAEGFKDINADNADEFNHQKTIIQVKPDIPKEVMEIVNNNLSPDYDLEHNITLLPDSSHYHIIITVGELIE